MNTCTAFQLNWKNILNGHFCLYTFFKLMQPSFTSTNETFPIFVEKIRKNPFLDPDPAEQAQDQVQRVSRQGRQRRHGDLLCFSTL
jgi:hypothetical protein